MLNVEWNTTMQLNNVMKSSHSGLFNNKPIWEGGGSNSDVGWMRGTFACNNSLSIYTPCKRKRKNLEVGHWGLMWKNMEKLDLHD